MDVDYYDTYYFMHIYFLFLFNEPFLAVVYAGEGVQTLTHFVPLQRGHPRAQFPFVPWQRGHFSAQFGPPQAGHHEGQHLSQGGKYIRR